MKLKALFIVSEIIVINYLIKFMVGSIMWSGNSDCSCNWLPISVMGNVWKSWIPMTPFTAASKPTAIVNHPRVFLPTARSSYINWNIAYTY